MDGIVGVATGRVVVHLGVLNGLAQICFHCVSVCISVVGGEGCASHHQGERVVDPDAAAAVLADGGVDHAQVIATIGVRRHIDAPPIAACNGRTV